MDSYNFHSVAIYTDTDLEKSFAGLQFQSNLWHFLAGKIDDNEMNLGSFIQRQCSSLIRLF